MGKGEIIKFKEIGVLLELKGENAFKIRAYQSGANERLEANFKEMVEGIFK